jgi:hypothetical protein
VGFRCRKALRAGWERFRSLRWVVLGAESLPKLSFGYSTEQHRFVPMGLSSEQNDLGTA